MPEGVFCCSVGSVLKQAGHGQFPLNFSYLLVKHFDGANDGLVGENSFAWGTRYTVIRTRDGGGVSHADVIDLTRRNIEDFDVREFYVALLSEFKKSGM
jgi:triacylglycerol lipase